MISWKHLQAISIDLQRLIRFRLEEKYFGASQVALVVHVRHDAMGNQPPYSWVGKGKEGVIYPFVFFGLFNHIFRISTCLVILFQFTVCC